MKKIALFTAGLAAAATMGVLGAGLASADPPDVVGEPYGRAVAVLKNQGYKVTFGGSIGSDLRQSQCIVIEQSSLSSGNQRLRLDCNLEEGEERPQAPNTHSLVPPGGSMPQQGTDGETGSRPTPGAGTVTVTPVPVG